MVMDVTFLLSPGRAAGTSLTFQAVPADCAMGSRVADASPCPSLGCLTGSVPQRPLTRADGQGVREHAAAFRQGERGCSRAWSDGLASSGYLFPDVLVPCHLEGCHRPRKKQTPLCVPLLGDRLSSP